LRRRKTRTRARELGAALAVALYLGGCGGGAEHKAAPPPRLPHPLASSLAVRSDAVADALAAGDSCRAAALATQLQRETIAAINRGRVPSTFQEPLSASVNELVSRVRCVPPPAPPTTEEPEAGRGKHKDEDKHKGKDKHKEKD
jgi:hypothetical protein